MGYCSPSIFSSTDERWAGIPFLTTSYPQLQLLITVLPSLLPSSLPPFLPPSLPPFSSSSSFFCLFPISSQVRQRKGIGKIPYLYYASFKVGKTPLTLKHLGQQVLMTMISRT